MEAGFDREWRIDELLDAATLGRTMDALTALAGGELAVLGADGGALWGSPGEDMARRPLVLELEPVGQLAGRGVDAERLAGAAALLQQLMRVQVRYKMASSLHLEAVAEDYESLRREHLKLQESEARYKQLSAQLEVRVKAQVALLEERQQMLYEAEKLASVGQLAAGVAHEVNNPLGFLRSNLSTFRHYLTQFAELKKRLAEGDAAWQALDLDFVLSDGEELLDEVRFTAGLDLKVVMADIAAIRTKIEEVYGGGIDFKELETLVSGPDPYEGIEVVIEDDDVAALEDLLRGTEAPPAIRLANAIILEAIRLGASDIHIQPRTKSVVVRYRIDGVLSDKIHIPHHLHQSLVSRLKIMSELDISERRRPQDGRITVKTPMRMVDLRISTLPTINGEKVVMRILDRNSAVHRLDQLGFPADSLPRISDMVAKPQGIILATGPTGSGKTTTLYSLLQHDATPDKNYVTIEDPVEYYLDMAGQVLVREKIGLTFPSVLRALLRQDPDVILLGEIRDFETAEVAFHAALTGHLVYSTLHTNSAVATIARLFDLGLKPYVVATALEGIIAQRLVRRICPACREALAPDPEVYRRLGPMFDPQRPVYRGRGCPECHQLGYRGRVGVYEVLSLDDELRDRIGSGASILEIRRLVREKGFRSVRHHAAELVADGQTTLDEVMRVLGPQGDSA